MPGPGTPTTIDRTICNNLVDLVLIVGLDDNSGLIPTTGQDEEDIDLNEIFNIQYDPQVLCAASSSTMFHFFPHARQDHDYPAVHPEILTKDHYVKGRTASRTRDLTRSRFGKAFYGSKQTYVSPVSVSRHMSVKGPTMKKNKAMPDVPECPVSEEIIKSITTFCYPEGMRVYEDKQENFVHFLVFTDIMGNKTYATCLTFFRRYILEKGEKAKFWINLDASEDDLEKQQIRCYIPHCCVLISKYPYFTVMKDALSYVVSQTEHDPLEFYTFVKSVTYKLTMTPVPLAGKLALEIDIGSESIFLFPPEKANRPVIDIPLHLVFLCFHSNEILKILAAILLEERIVFMSNSYALLTTIMQSFLNFIQPFEWRYSFVPLLTIEALELLEAPGTFMMGCHSQHKQEVEQIEGIVMVDIDEGWVTVNPTKEMSTSMSDSIDSLHDIPEIPDESARLFRNVCRKAKYQHDIVELQRTECFNTTERRKREKLKISELNSTITTGCLELMVNLYRGIMPEIRQDHKRFNRTSFLDNTHGPDRKFYEKALKTDMFKIFLKDRIEGKTDQWSQMEVLTRVQVQKAGGSQGKTNNRRGNLRKQVSVTLMPGILQRKELKIIKLPSIDKDLRVYIKDTIRLLTEYYKNSNDLQDRASYLYLRAVFRIAEYKNKEALADLTRLAEIDISLVPQNIASLAFHMLPDEEKLEISRSPGVQQITELLHLDSTDSHCPRESTKVDDPIKIPDHDLSFEEFCKLISLLEMSQDMETILRLFQALELSQQNGYDKVDNNTFEAFVHCYQENQEHCKMVDDHYLDEHEDVLKLSGLCKTDAGSGRIVLTNKRLFFMKDGSRECLEVVKIRDIILIEKKQLKSFFKSIDVLRIHAKDEIKFTSWLKDERDHWYILLQELWAGKIVSIGTKDIMAATKAANNVQLVDAYLKSSEDEETTHHESSQEVAKVLCYFTKYMEEKKHELPRETLETLVNRIDPCAGESLRQSVQSLLYTPGDQHNLPRLWCGMGDGKIKVFNGTTWNLESQFIQTKSVVMCLADVGNGQIWAGAQYIYIIDSNTLHCNRAPLTEHIDAVVSIVVVDSGRYVYTASVDGAILKWDVPTITVVDRNKAKIKDLISLKHFSDLLWCGTRTHIYQLDLKGNILQKYSTSGPGSEIFNFHITDNQIWIGYRRCGKIAIISLDGGGLDATIEIDNCDGISAIIQQENKIWVGSKTGSIHIISITQGKVIKTLQAHDDAVRALCCAENRYIISGAGSRDGRVAMWSPTDTKTDSGRYILDDT